MEIDSCLSMNIFSVFDDFYVGTLNFDRQRPTSPGNKAKKIETVVILDNSGSMGDNVARLAENVLPLAFREAGYSDDDPLTVITFESESQLYQTTVGKIAKLGLKSEGSTYMSKAIHNLEKVLRTFKDDSPIRLLSLSDGALHDQEDTVAAATQLAPLFSERAFNSQAIRYFTSESDPDTRGLASVLQFSTIDVKDSLRAGLIDVNSMNTSDEELAKMIAGLFRHDGVDSDFFLVSNTPQIHLVPWQSIQLSKVRLSYGENVFWFTKVPSDLTINGQEAIAVKLCGQLTFQNLKMVDHKLQALGFKIKALQVVSSEASEAELKQAKMFFHKFFAALEATLPLEDAENATVYKQRLALFKDKLRRNLKDHAAQFKHIFNPKNHVRSLNSAQHAVYMQQCNAVKNFKSVKMNASCNASSMNSRRMNSSNRAGPYQRPLPPQVNLAVANNVDPAVASSKPSLWSRIFGSGKKRPSSPPSNCVPIQQQQHSAFQLPQQQQQAVIVQEQQQVSWGDDQSNDDSAAGQVSEVEVELDEMEITLELHDEVKAMRDHLSELDGIDDANHAVSFFSYATTLAGIKAVCELHAEDEIFDTFDAMDILQLINIVGIACHAPIGEFKDPSFWQVSKIFPGCYMSISDLVVASKQSGDRAYLTVPQTSERITSVIPYFEDERIQTFLQTYAPKLLEYSCSIGMRNKLAFFARTYAQTMASGIWKLSQDIALSENKLEVTIKSLCHLVKSYASAANESEYSRLFDAAQDKPVYKGGKLLAVNLLYCGLQRFVGQLILMTKRGEIASLTLMPRILRALYAHETFVAIKVAIQNENLRGKLDVSRLVSGDEATFLEFEAIIKGFDAIALLPTLLQLSFDQDALEKIKHLPVLDESTICEALGISYSLREFKIFNIVQAFAFDSKATRWDNVEKQMAIIDLVDRQAAEQMTSIYVSSL